MKPRAEVTHDVASNAIFLPNNVFAAAQGLAYRVVTMAAGSTVPLYVVPQAQVMATLSAVADERMQTAAGMYEVRRHVLDLDNAGTPMVLMLWAEKATGRLIRYSIAAAGVDVVREDLTSVFTREVKEFRENDQTLLIPAVGLQPGRHDLAAGGQGRSRQEGQERREVAGHRARRRLGQRRSRHDRPWHPGDGPARGTAGRRRLPRRAVRQAWRRPERRPRRVRNPLRLRRRRPERRRAGCASRRTSTTVASTSSATARAAPSPSLPRPAPTTSRRW